MLSLGCYLLGALKVLVVAGALGFAAYRIRRRVLPSWSGSPARLVETVTAVALLTWLTQLLGSVELFYPGTLVAGSVLFGLAARFLPAGGAVGGPTTEEALATAGRGGTAATGPAGPGPPALLIALGVIALVVFHWGITAKHALDRGIFNFDSLWYHQPFSVDMVQSHSLTGMWHVETVFTNWFYPQNSELLHAVGIALTERDTLSLLLNFGWLAVAFLAAWGIGRPYGKGHLSVVAVAVLLECHTLVVREPGAAKNDLMAAALLLAGIAILVEAWNRRRVADLRPAIRDRGLPHQLEPGWALAAAGLAVGLAAGTKVTVLAMAAALSVVVLGLAPRGRRGAAAGWWFVPALL